MDRDPAHVIDLPLDLERKAVLDVEPVADIHGPSWPVVSAPGPALPALAAA